MSCFFKLQIIQSTKHQTSQWQNKLFGIGREDLANFSWAQHTYSALFLIPQMHVPYKWGTIWKGTKQAKTGKKHCYHREIIYQTQISLLFVPSLLTHTSSCLWCSCIFTNQQLSGRRWKPACSVLWPPVVSVMLPGHTSLPVTLPGLSSVSGKGGFAFSLPCHCLLR